MRTWSSLFGMSEMAMIHSMKKLTPILTRKVTMAQEILRDHGTKKFLFEIVPWMFHRKYDFYSQPIEFDESLFSCQVSLRVDLVKGEDIFHILKIRPGFYDQRTIRDRLNEGHKCFMGWSDGRPVLIRWAFVRSVYLPYLHRTLFLSPGDVYIDEGFTIPEYRNKGVYSAAGPLVRKILLEMGYLRIFCAIATWDTNLRTYSGKILLKKIGEGGYRSIFGHKQFFWRGGIHDNGDGTISFSKKG
jgi:hypothetical protein